MADFVIEGGFDDRGILEGFKRVEAAGQQAGQKVGAALDKATAKKLEIKADPRSIVAMRERLEELQRRLERVNTGSAAFRDLSAQARTAEASLNRATKAAGGLGSALGKGIGGELTSQLAGLASITGVIALFKGAIDQAVQLETITRKLSNTLGPQGAAGALSFTKGLADQLGLSYTTLASTFGGFTAAASAANVPIETQRGLFAAVAKSAQALGLSNDELQGSLLALQQIASKGTVSMEELRGQLGERLPIAFGAAAKGLGVTQQQLIKLVESGRLTAGEFFPALTKGLNELTVGAGGTATAAQNFQLLGNEIAALQEKAGRELLPGVLAFVQALTGGLQGPIKSELASTTSAIGFLQAQIKEQTAFGLDTTDAQQKLSQLQLQAEELRTKLASQTRQDEIKIEILGLEKQRRDLERQGVATDAVKEKVKLLSQELFLLSGSAEAVNLGQIFNGLSFDTISVVPTLTAQLVKAREEQESINQQIEIQSAARQRLVAAGRSTEAVDARLLQLAEKKKGLAAGLGLAQQDLIAAKKAEEAAQAAANQRTQRALDIDKARKSAAVELNKLRLQEPVRALDNQLLVGQQVLSFSQAASNLEQSRFDVVRARNQFEIDNAGKLKLTQQQIAAREAANAELQKQALIARYQGLLQTQQVEAVMFQLTQRRAAVEAQIAVITAQQAAALAQQKALELQASGAPAADVGKAIEAARLAQQQVIYAQQKVAILGQIAPLEAQVAQANAETARQQLLAQGAALGIEQQLRNITELQQIYSNAWRASVQDATKLPGSINTLARSTGEATKDVGQIGSGFIQVGNSIKTFTSGQFKDGVSDAASSARAFAGSMSDSAASADQLLRSLQSAAGLAPSRFTGGPVQGGQQYRINDGPGGRSLGQEAFLSKAGDLSLINRPYSSMWTAPSSGIVLPAVLTDQLKQRGAFDTGRAGGGRVAAAVAAGTRPGGQASTARLELAVTALTAKVDALTKKNWTVQQRVTNSPGSTQVRLLSSML